MTWRISLLYSFFTVLLLPSVDDEIMIVSNCNDISRICYHDMSGGCLLPKCPDNEQINDEIIVSFERGVPFDKFIYSDIYF